MISLDQVKLLEQKVESAVAKIQQLQAENDALRTRCSELTNALSTKSEQLTFFEQDQNQIESGILNALDRLNSIENQILRAAGSQSANTTQVSSPVVPQQSISQVHEQKSGIHTYEATFEPAPAKPVVAPQPEVSQPTQFSVESKEAPVSTPAPQKSEPSIFDDVFSQDFSNISNGEDFSDNSNDSGFDIF